MLMDQVLIPVEYRSDSLKLSIFSLNERNCAVFQLTFEPPDVISTSNEVLKF